MLKGWKKLKAALDVSSMATKYSEMQTPGRRNKKGHVPRGGGLRAKGSFDTLDRYRQHTWPKRYNPTRDMFIHNTQVRRKNKCLYTSAHALSRFAGDTMKDVQLTGGF